MLPSINVAVAAEDIRNLRPRAAHCLHSEVFGRRRWCDTRRWMGEQLQGACRAADLVCGDPEILGGGGQGAMAEQQLNSADICACFEQMDGERMAQGMGCHRL